MKTRRLALAGAGALALCGGAIAVGALVREDGRIGPDRALLNSGRHLRPYGRRIPVGGFPTGAALTPDGRYYWTVSTGRGIHDVRIVSVRSGRVLQILRIPGASGGIAMDPVTPTVYVSGVKDSSYAGQKAPESLPGRGGDVIHVFTYSRRTGSASRGAVIPVPPPADAPAPQNFPPTNVGAKISWPDRLAVSPDGKQLLVPLNLADSAAIIDVATKAVRYVPTGHYPYGAAILRDGKTGLVSNETPGTVSVIDLAAGKKVKDITVGAHLSHPEAIAVDPKADRAYVAIANSDQVAVIDTKRLVVQKTLSVGRNEGLGTAPVALTVTPDGTQLLVAESGADEIAVFSLPAARARAARADRVAVARAAGEAVLAREISRAQARVKPSTANRAEGERESAAALRRADAAFALVGRIPTAQYPTDVAVTSSTANPCGTRTAARRTKKAKRCARLLYLSGKGLGTGPNPDGPQPNSKDDSDDGINKTQYLPLLNIGSVGLADMPSVRTLKTLTKRADKQLHPTNAERAPADTPLKPGGPIKHVFYIVRENRTYDQIMGDEPRGDGDPKLALFGGDTTPNVHALAQRFPLLDHVYANSEASIDGHFWASAAKVSDYVNKNWFQNYGGRGRPYDFGVYAVTWPGNGFLFDQAERQGISYFNYGEAIAGTIGIFPDKDRNAADLLEVTKKFAKSDLGVGGCYANDASIGYDAITQNQVWDSVVPPGAQPLATSRTSCFQTRFAVQDATNAVPAFNYLTLTNDHTNTLNPGSASKPNRTPRAMIADNDEAVGRIVDTISHSKIWKSSAIFVIEDDSQDGADHVDAHRIPAFVISPYAKQGAVVHTRYDFLSVIRSMELILGMKPLGLFDQLATPMYDAFQGSPSNDAPVSYVPAKRNLLEYNPRTGAGARAASKLPTCLDCAGQRDLDRLLWQSVHGLNSEPPPPGPNADGVDKVRLGEGAGGDGRSVAGRAGVTAP